MSDASSKIPGALQRYRVMAFVTGTLLMIVFLGLLRYIPAFEGSRDTLDPILGPIAILHGWVFMVYLVTVTQLWMLMRWDIPRLLFMAAGGVVPLLSFFAERRVHAEVSAHLEEAKP
ncbi:DUF3817 domain-containing protein [Demequina soli]|uniref:DUF3817 domain-containing protein n=1 Tax=Demequina soli TaxID=1638987 RepID=UPI00078020F3|nr:DUF3817 domain-containing protein [Demequina soli]